MMNLNDLFSMRLFDHVWQSTLFAAFAALLAFLLRKNRAGVRHAIWLSASLKFLVPFSLLVVAGTRLQSPVAAPLALQPKIVLAVHQVRQAFTAPSVSVSDWKPAHAVSSIPVLRILFAIWLCGLIIILFRWSCHWIRARDAVRKSVPLALETPIPVLSSPSLVEPGVFGIVRPVLLLPDGITEHLSSSHLTAIVAHELCHVRRRDNLSAALHMLVEAIFWFHPLVWWIGSRLVEERERACDEEVIRLGNQPSVYAESILKTCRFYVQSPLACVSGVTGSDLKKRVVQIMTINKVMRLSACKKLFLAAVASTVLALPIAIGLATAALGRSQSQPTASFEVASIKPNKSGEQRFMLRMQPGGRFEATGMTVKFLIQQAYDVKESQITGDAPWLNTERYDIDAKPDDTTSASFDKMKPDDRKQLQMQMLQSLLSDRFKLGLGHETKEMQIYAMVIANGGPKIKKSDFVPPDKPPASMPPPGGQGATQPRGGLWMQGPGNLTSTGTQLAMLTNLLSHMVGRIVVDKTGLEGRYDFTLKWAAEPGQMPPPPPGVEVPPETEAGGPSIFTAMQEQLGLKLESQKAPVDILVIKHVEKPSEN